MFRFRTYRLTIALIAQVLFCLVAAPVIAAQQVALAQSAPANTDAPAPGNSSAIIQAAFDAANMRPEELSDTEQKKGIGRQGVQGSFRGRGEVGSGRDTNATLAHLLAAESDSTVVDPSASIEFVLDGALHRTIQKTGHSDICLSTVTEAKAEFANPSAEILNSAESPHKPFRVSMPAIQPTGPPA